MKRLIVALTIAFMFVAGSAFAATWTGTLYGTPIIDYTGGLIAPVSNPSSDFTFEMDGDSMVTSSVTVTYTQIGEDGPETKTSYTRSTNMDWDLAGIVPAGTNTYYGGALVVGVADPSTDEGLPMNLIRHFIYDGSGDYYHGGPNPPMTDTNWNKTSSPWQVEPRQSYFTAVVNGTAYDLAIYGISVNAAATTADHMEGVLWLSLAFDGGVDAAGAYKWEADLGAPPVPIPAAAWLLLSGLVGIVGLRRKG